MFQASQRRTAGRGANRWLLLAGLGLLVLGFVLRMMLDIGAVGSSAADGAAVGTAAVDTAAVDTAAVDTAGVPTAAPPTAAVPTAAVPTAVVQLGLFSREANARGLKARADAAGFPASIHPEVRGARTLYRVSVDGMPTEEAAKRAADSLSKVLQVKAVVVTQGR